MIIPIPNVRLVHFPKAPAVCPTGFRIEIAQRSVTAENGPAIARACDLAQQLPFAEKGAHLGSVHVLAYPEGGDNPVLLYLKTKAVAVEGPKLVIDIEPEAKARLAPYCDWQYHEPEEKKDEEEPVEARTGEFVDSELYMIAKLTSEFRPELNPQRLADRMRQVAPLQAIAEALTGGGPKNE